MITLNALNIDGDDLHAAVSSGSDLYAARDFAGMLIQQYPSVDAVEIVSGDHYEVYRLTPSSLVK